MNSFPGVLFVSTKEDIEITLTQDDRLIGSHREAPGCIRKKNLKDLGDRSVYLQI